MGYDLLLLMCSGICGVIQTGFYVKIRHGWLTLPAACCFGAAALPFLAAEGAATCVICTAAVLAVTSVLAMPLYRGPRLFRLYNILLQHIMTLGALLIADAIVYAVGPANPLLLRMLIALALDAAWVGIMLYAHLHVFKLVPLEEESYRQTLWYCGYAIAVLLFVIFVRRQFADARLSTGRLGLICAVLSAAAIAAVALATKLNSASQQKMMMKRQLQLIESQNELLAQRVSDEVKFTRCLRRLRHDFQNQLISLEGLLSTERVSEANTMLQAMIKETVRIESTTYCDEPLVNVVLQYLAGKCADMGVTLRHTIRLPDALQISDATLSALLMNIANNAVECCQKLAEPRKGVIDLTLFLQNEFLVVRCRNTVDAAPQIRENRIASTKDDPNGEHGIGLVSIQAACEEHGGRMELQAENGFFTITAILKNEAR